MKSNRHRSPWKFLVLMTFAILATTAAFADNNHVTQPQVPLTDTYTYTLMPTVVDQQTQATVDTSPVLTLTAEQFTIFRTFQQNNRTTVAKESILGTLTLNGAVFRVVPANEAQTFKADTGFITFKSFVQQAKNTGVEATLTLSGNYVDRIVELRTTEKNQQIMTAPVNFARMQVNGINLALVLQTTDVTQKVAHADTTTDDVNRDGLAFKQKETSIEAPTATTTPMKK